MIDFKVDNPLQVIEFNVYVTVDQHFSLKTPCHGQLHCRS